MENAARQNQADAYSGIKNVEEFDKVISEITLQNDNGRLGNQSASNKIVLSKEAIEELRGSIQFDKGKIRGFNKSSLMQKELNLNQQLKLYENLSKCEIIIKDKNENILIKSIAEKDENSSSDRKYTMPNGNLIKPKYIIIIDHRPLPYNDCLYYPEAECWVYGNF